MENLARTRKAVTRRDVNDLLDVIRKEKITPAQSVKALMYFGNITSIVDGC